MKKLERIVQIAGAYDKRHPDPNKSYGIHGVTMRFVLKGPEGAVQFVLYTNWQLPHVEREFDVKPTNADHFFCKPMPSDLGYHSKVPQYEGQTSMGRECEYLDGGECYYDGSTLNAKEPYEIMVKGGGDALWAYLEEYYQDRLVPAPLPGHEC